MLRTFNIHRSNSLNDYNGRDNGNMHHLLQLVTALEVLTAARQYSQRHLRQLRLLQQPLLQYFEKIPLSTSEFHAQVQRKLRPSQAVDGGNLVRARTGVDHLFAANRTEQKW